MKVTLAQLNPIVGDLVGNRDKLFEIVKQHSLKTEPQLIVFSELFLCGYPPRDLLHRRSFLAECLAVIEQIKEFSMLYPQVGILFGAPIVRQPKAGKGIYNAAVLIHQGQILGEVYKTLLPTYDVFDEDRYFDPATEFRVIPFYDEVLGISICEDAWNVAVDQPSFLQNRYIINPLQKLVEQGATLLINLSASPFNFLKEQERLALFVAQVKQLKKPFIYVNQVGANDELVFDGTSLCLNEQALPVAVLAHFAEEVQTVETKTWQPVEYQFQDKTQAVYQALVLGVQDYFKKCRQTKALLGLSGGIDSALTAVIARDALGAENVLGIAMPSKYSSPGSIVDAEKLAKNLGIAFKLVPINDVVESLERTLQQDFAGTPFGLAEENIQARIRGNILMAFSNKFGYLVLSTGNKSELAMGYCTLYGDMSGGLDVLADVAKTLVYDLSIFVNRDGEVIPIDSITKPPSAELRPNQKDQDTLPDYPVLDAVLELLIAEGVSVAEIIEKGFDADMVNWIANTVQRNEYKRRQAAPGLKISTKAFGVGRRFPIAVKYTL